MIRNILVPTDFSSFSEVAIERSLPLVRALSAHLHLLHAFDVGIHIPFPEQVALPPDFIESVRAGAQAELERLEKRLVDTGVSCTTHISALPPVSAILELAEALPADLIVMATHGRTGLKHVLLGSVAERTVRLAPCPVMTVKAEERS